MRTADHIRIANIVASAEPRFFTKDVLDSFKQGCEYPDKNHVRIAHHRNRQEDIKKHILNSRSFFLQGNLSKSAFSFGIACHFIADSTCPGSETRSAHQRFENEISRVPIPKRITPRIFTTPNELKNMVRELRKKSTPDGAFRTSIV